MAIFGKKEENKKQEDKARARAPRYARAATPLYGTAHETIRAPWFSEKALIMTERGVYTFSIPANATKADIAGSIKEIYNIKPRAVRIVAMPGKTKSLRTRRGVGTRSARRKAYVYLNKGDTIQLA